MRKPCHENSTVHSGPEVKSVPNLPARVDRKRGAQLITELYFPISHRTLEVWPILWRRVNGRATCDTAELLSIAEKKLDAAPIMLGGKKRPPCVVIEK